MGSMPPLLAFLLMGVSGWVHRRQLIVIEFLQAENRLLKEYPDPESDTASRTALGSQNRSRCALLAASTLRPVGP